MRKTKIVLKLVTLACDAYLLWYFITQMPPEGKER